MADGTLDALKLPPQSLEAEQSVLGGILLDNGAWDQVAALVVAEDFYRHPHQLIFAAIKRLIEEGKPADYLTVSENLSALGQLEQLPGGAAYLLTLVQNTPSAANAHRYAEIVREYAIFRRLVTLGNRISGMAFQPEGRDARALLDEAERLVFEIAEAGNRFQGDMQKMRPVIEEILERTERLYGEDRDDDVIGTPSGFSDLDRMTAGFQEGDLIIVAGRPSMGKTAFALNITEYVGVEQALPVAVFSMEMGASQLVTRMLASTARVDQSRLRIGKLTDEDWERFYHGIAKLENASIHIDETGQMTPFEIRSKARRLSREYGGKLGLIVIDYIQMMVADSGGKGRSENRATELSEISRALKSMAKELKVPVIALSQLSRGVESRNDKRPMMSDLRESGAIEQDADLILMLYRDEYYNKESEDKGIAELIVGKHRNGPTGIVKLSFQGEYTRFGNLINTDY